MVNAISNNNIAALDAIEQSSAINLFNKEADLAQYKGCDYSNALKVARGITLEEAARIAAADPQVDYFCYVKGLCMVLESSQEHAQNDPLGLISYNTFQTDAGEVKTDFVRVFEHGDVVFFNNSENKKQLGTAPGLCDTYQKIG